FISQNFEKLEPWIKTIGVAFGLLIARAFPLTTLFTAIWMGIDDVLKYMQGGESIIGDFIKWLQDVLGVSEDVAEGMAGLAAAVSSGLLVAFTLAPATTARIVARLVTPLIAAIGTSLAGSSGLAAL